MGCCSICESLLRSEEQLWQLVEQQGDEQSHFLLEAFVPGDVFHVDSIVSERKVVFAEVHKCLTPPFDVAHAGGVFATHTIERNSDDDIALRAVNERLLDVLRLVRGVSHAEFIKGKDDRFYMLECAARVGGAHITDLIEGSTGVNLWEEWAKIEVADLERRAYTPPASTKKHYGGLALTLAREPNPDTSRFSDPEIVYRSPEEHHVGLVVASPTYRRAEELTKQYASRFRDEYSAAMPARDKPSR
jgi:hypothetical protein